jgi:hypothetical protein
VVFDLGGRRSRRSPQGEGGLVFHPLELLERLAAIIPRPQINLLIYRGVLAPNSHWRSRVVAYGRPAILPESESNQNYRDAVDPHPSGPRNYTWADLMRRTFGYDVMACLECGGRMRLIAMIDKPAVIAKILDHLGLPDRDARGPLRRAGAPDTRPSARRARRMRLRT